MEKKALYDGFVALEQEAEGLLKRVSALKNEMGKVLEQNAELTIENQQLRDHLKELRVTEDKKTGTAELSKPKLNLEKLYEEGFHVCPYMYGQRRIGDEACAFCLDIIYGEHDAN